MPNTTNTSAAATRSTATATAARPATRLPKTRAITMRPYVTPAPCARLFCGRRYDRELILEPERPVVHRLLSRSHTSLDDEHVGEPRLSGCRVAGRVEPLPHRGEAQRRAV